MKRKNTIRIIEILFIISILITFFSIQRTYAKYFEKVGTTYNTNIKKWVISINNNNIHDMDSLSKIMQPVLVENENMNSNETLIPGREGYFDMVLDYNYVDLAFEYTFSIEQLNNTKLADFEIYGYSVIDGENPEVVETKEIKGVIDPTTELDSNGEKKKDIRILFRWNDGEGSTMNNASDTQFRGEKNTASDADKVHTILKYKAIVTFSQYIA